MCFTMQKTFMNQKWLLVLDCVTLGQGDSMKLIIQIPCFNEEKTLPLVFEKMPKTIPGIDVIEYQIVDDGSTDRTVEVARSLGVKHIVTYRGKNRRWLGRAFRLGADNALLQGADILVNTDGDN